MPIGAEDRVEQCFDPIGGNVGKGNEVEQRWQAPFARGIGAPRLSAK
jgi:hypothetical protein